MTDGGGQHWLLIRRRISDGEYAFYRAREFCDAHLPGIGQQVLDWASGPAFDQLLVDTVLHISGWRT